MVDFKVHTLTVLSLKQNKGAYRNRDIYWNKALGRMPIVLATFTCSGENVIDL